MPITIDIKSQLVWVYEMVMLWMSNNFKLGIDLSTLDSNRINTVKSLIDNLSQQCSKQSQAEHKEFNRVSDFFLEEKIRDPFNQNELEEIVGVAKRLTKNKKQMKIQEAIDFIILLFQSNMDRLHKSRDIIYRNFLKLI